MRTSTRVVLLVSFTATTIATLGCKGDAPATTPPTASASAVPVDRLAKGELAPGTEKIYGLVLPRGMRVIARFPGAVHAAGSIPPEEVANYVRKRVVVSRVELGAAKTIFPSSRIKAGDPKRVYQIEVAEDRKHGTVLQVRDVTKPPPPPAGLTDEQRLKQVGLGPNGELLNRSKLQ